MSKTVKEQTLKFFYSYSDALNDVSYHLETLEFEGETPLSVEILTGKFRLKSFTRYNGVDRFVEQVYIKVE